MVTNAKKLLQLIFSVTATLQGAAGKGREKAQNDGAHDVEHQSSSTYSSIVAYATTEGGKQINQDSVDDCCLDGCNVLAIADGVSGSPHGELAAEAAVKGFLSKITEVWKQSSTGTIGRGEIREAYNAACAGIKKCVEQTKEEKDLHSLNPQTTFIGIIDLPDRF